MIGSISERSRRSSQSLRSWAGDSMFRPKRMNAPGWMRRKAAAVCASITRPGTPVMRSWPRVDISLVDTRGGEMKKPEMLQCLHCDALDVVETIAEELRSGYGQPRVVM